MKLNSYERNRLDKMIDDCEEYKRTHDGQEMMIVLSDAGLQGYALKENTIYPIVWRSDIGMVQNLGPEHCGMADFIAERFMRRE